MVPDTSKTSCSSVYNIEYKLYICIYDFLKNKKIIVLDRASTTGRSYGPSTARRSCRVGPDTIKSVMPRAGQADTTNFAILLLFSLPSCLHLRATPFSMEGVGEGASSPYSSDTSPDTDSHSGYCMSMWTFHIMRASSFSPLSDVPFIFPAFMLFFLVGGLRLPKVLKNMV
jgi:hypothetical protein